MHRRRTLFAPEGSDGAGGGSGGGAGVATAPGGAGAGAERSLIPPVTAPPASGAPTTGADGKPVVAETWWKGFFKEDGTVDKSRLNHLPEDLKGDHALFARFHKVDDVFKSLAHHARTAREKGLTPLREGATPEETADHMRRLALVNNVPEQFEGYGIKVEDPELQKDYDKFLGVFHKHALSPEAVKELVALNESMAKEKMEQVETDMAREEDARWKEQEKLITREFGPFKQEKFAAARSGARWMGLDPDSPMFKQNAALIVAAAKVGEKIGEARFVDGEGAATGATDPEAEISAMVNDPSHKYYDILRNPGKNQRFAQEAFEYQRKLGEQIAAKKLRQAQGR